MVKDYGFQPSTPPPPPPPPAPMETDEWARHDDDLEIFNWPSTSAASAPASRDIPDSSTWTQGFTPPMTTMRSPDYVPDLQPSTAADDNVNMWDPDYTEVFNALSPSVYTTPDVTVQAQPSSAASGGDADLLNTWLHKFNTHCPLSSLVNNVSDVCNNVQVGTGVSRKRAYVDDGQIAGPSHRPDRIVPPPPLPPRDGPPPPSTRPIPTPSPLPPRAPDEDFELLRFQDVYAEKFRFSITDYSLKINDPVTATNDVEFQAYLKRVLQRVLDLIKSADMGENTVLRLVISTAGMTNPVSIPFTDHNSVTVDLFLTFLQNQCQSNSEFSITDELLISVQRAERHGNGGVWWHTRGPNKHPQLLLDE